jgi:hypothetical protein
MKPDISCAKKTGHFNLLRTLLQMMLLRLPVARFRRVVWRNRAPLESSRENPQRPIDSAAVRRHLVAPRPFPMQPFPFIAIFLSTLAGILALDDGYLHLGSSRFPRSHLRLEPLRYAGRDREAAVMQPLARFDLSLWQVLAFGKPMLTSARREPLLFPKAASDSVRCPSKRPFIRRKGSSKTEENDCFKVVTAFSA